MDSNLIANIFANELYTVILPSNALMKNMSRTSDLKNNLCIRVQEIDLILNLYRDAANEKKGKIIFLAGFPGSGRTETLRALVNSLNREKQRPIIVAGHFGSRGEYEPWETGKAMKVSLSKIINVIGNVMPVLGIIGGPIGSSIINFAAQVVKASTATWEFINSYAKQGKVLPEFPGGLKTLLREASLKQPVVCIMDDFDLAEGSLWRDLLIMFATEVSSELPLLFILSMEGAPDLGEHEPSEPDCLYMARRLRERSLALWHALLPLSSDEVAKWIGRADVSLINLILEITGGNPKWIMQLWEDWRKRNVVMQNQSSGRWSLSVGQTDQASGPVWDIFGDRIQKLMGTKDLRTFEETVRLLSFAALEGRQFTAQALARVFNRNHDELMDFLDKTLLVCEENPDGLLTEVGFLTINDYHGEKNLFRYSFTTDLFWMTLNRYGLTTTDIPDLAHRLGQILIDEYSPQERQIARTLARLFRLAGDKDSKIKYQRMADFDMSVSANRLLAKHILSLPKDEWNKFDYVRAISQVLDAGIAMYGCCPYSETLQVFEEVYEMALEYRQYTDKASALIYRADVLLAMGEYGSARALLPRLYRLRSRIKDKSLEAHCLFEVAKIRYTTATDVDTCHKYLQDALKIYRQLENRLMEFYSLELLGVIALQNRNYGEAYQLSQEIEKIAQEMGDEHILGRSYYLQAMVLDFQAKYDSARNSILRALESTRDLSPRSHNIPMLSELVSIELHNGNDKAARLYSIEGLQTAKAFGDSSNEGVFWVFLGLAQANLGWRSLAMQLIALGYLILNSRGHGLAPISYTVLSEVASIEHCGKDQLATLLNETEKVYETDKGLGLLQKAIDANLKSRIVRKRVTI